MIFLDSSATCEFCGSKELKLETARVEDPLFPDQLERIKCCNCGKVLLKDYEENQHV